MTVALYARRKSWPLEAVTVRLRHSKIHAADCADCETKEGMLDHIESDLEFAGRLTQEQRSKLLEIAEKCPVHRTLVSEIDIRPAWCEQWRTSVGLRSKGVVDRDPM
jgi:putative redox protein